MRLLRRSLPRIDKIGLALVGAFGAWIAYDGWLTYGLPGPSLIYLLLCVAAYVGGRLGTRYVGRWFIPTLVVGLAVMVVLSSPARIYNRANPSFLGYTNANASFFVLASFAALMIATRRQFRQVTALIPVVIALFLAVPVAMRSMGAFIAALFLVPAAVVAFKRPGQRRVIITALMVIVGLAVMTSLVVAEMTSRESGPRYIFEWQVLDEGRAAVWADAYKLLRAHPLRGVGPENFQRASETARADPDLRWAHNEYLQQGAETGVPGLILLIAVIGWLFFRLRQNASIAARLAAFALAAISVHACVDYIFHFLPLPLVLFAMVGSATGRGSQQLREASREPELDTVDREVASA